MRKKIMAIIMVIILVSCSYSFFAIRAVTLGEQQQEVQQRRDEAEQKLEYVQNELSTSVFCVSKLFLASSISFFSDSIVSNNSLS